MEKKKEFKMPHAFVILVFVIAIMSVATHFIPAGAYDRIAGVDGRMLVNPDSYHMIESTPIGISDFLMAIPNGLSNSADLIFFTLLIGSAVAVINKIGVLPAGMDALTNKFKNRGILLIPIIMFFIATCDSLIGMCELCLLYVPLLLPLMIKMNFDSVTALATVFCASAAGFTAALTNPFSIVISQKIVGLPLYSGIGFRMVTFAAFLSVSMLYVTHYASKVLKNPEASLTYKEDQEKRERILKEADAVKKEKLDGRTKFAGMFALGVFVFMIFGLIKFGWDLPQMSACCIIIGVGADIISGCGINNTCDYMVTGCCDMMLGALMVGIARAVSVVMTQGQILDTVVHKLASLLNGLPASATIIGIFLIITLLNFFIGSASGKAIALFPIISPLASVLGITQQTAVLAYQFGDGFTNYIWPTSGWMWGCLGMAGVSYQKWCRFYIPLLLIFVVMASIILIIAHTIQFGPF